MSEDTQQAVLVSSEETAPSRPEGACLNYTECGNYPPGYPDTRNKLCDDCLDEMRSRGDGLEGAE
jgi:hypothetical protein